MIEIVIRTLPHGTVPFTQIKDGNVKNVVMMLNENIVMLKRQLEAAQNAIIELQRRKQNGT